MWEEWGKQIATLVAGSAIWIGILKFFGRRELDRIDGAVELAQNAADGMKTSEAIDRCIDRLNSIDKEKADRSEITNVFNKLEATLEKHEASRTAMYAKFDHHQTEMHKIDSKLSQLIGEVKGIRSTTSSA